jgi:hemerythrin-like domain-containing protein
VLFPAFEARTGMSMGPTQVMRAEHEQMRALIEDLARTVTGSDQDGYLGLSETLNMLMQQHNVKEENMLYPMSDQLLAADREQLIIAMQATQP